MFKHYMVQVIMEPSRTTLAKFGKSDMVQPNNTVAEDVDHLGQQFYKRSEQKTINKGHCVLHRDHCVGGHYVANNTAGLE